MGEILSHRSPGLGPLARNTGRSYMVQFAATVALSAIASDAVAEGIAEGKTSVRKVEGPGIEVADARAEEAVARMVKKTEEMHVGFMLAIGIGD